MDQSGELILSRSLSRERPVLASICATQAKFGSTHGAVWADTQASGLNRLSCAASKDPTRQFPIEE